MSSWLASHSYLFKACLLAEDTLIHEHMAGIRSPMEKKVRKVHGILKIMEPCAHILGRPLDRIVHFILWLDLFNYSTLDTGT